MDAPHDPTPAGAAPLLVMRGIHKWFPGVHALKGVDLDVRAGEVHALVGENGAGKSTLMHILAGVYPPDAGTIALGSQERVVIANEHAAQQFGIAIVYQERSLFGPLSVAENIFAGRQPINRWGKINRRRLRLEASALMRQIGLEIDPRVALEKLPPAQQQMIEIAKALSIEARLVIFDEPTAALTHSETQTLFGVIGRLKAQGAGVIYISHRLEEVFRIADRVTVLKDGEGQGTFPVAATSPDHLVSRMVGRDLSLFRRRHDPPLEGGPVVFEARHVTERAAPGAFSSALRNVSLAVRAGEIVALAGLAGAGRTEFALTIFGARPRETGEILVDGRPVPMGSPAAAIAAGIGYLPEDRKEAGLFLEMSVSKNIVASALDRFGSWWFRTSRADGMAEEFRRRLRIASRGVRQAVKELSGGNQQKVMLARWLLVQPRILIADEPTRGLDVGAKAEVHSLLYELSRNGAAVLVISSELPEVLAVADRIAVMREGRIAGELSRAEATEEKILRLASIA